MSWNTCNSNYIVLICVLLIAVSGCARLSANDASESERYHTGQLHATVSTATGPLQAELWRVDYSGGINEAVDGTRFVMPPKVVVYLRLTNNGASPILVYDATQPGDRLGSLYYLVDEQERRYPLRGRGWTYRPDDGNDLMERDVTPTSSMDDSSQVPHRPVLPGEGIIQPEETAELTLTFQGVPASVERLTLVMEQLRMENGEKYTLTLPVPLPENWG